MSNTRIITVFSTKGQQKAKIETDVTKWGDLAQLIRDEGYDLDNLHATENVNRHDLNHPDGTLPLGEFTVFLRPKKTKSGLDVKGLSYKELRELVKERKDDEKFMEHMNRTGVNWTRLKADDLSKQLKKWEDNKATPAKKSGAVEKASEKPSNTAVATEADDVMADIKNRLEKVKEHANAILEGLENLPALNTASNADEESQRLIKEAKQICEALGC